jgi:hypothetical protein
LRLYRRASLADLAICGRLCSQTPRPIIERLQRELKAVVSLPDVRKKMIDQADSHREHAREIVANAPTCPSGTPTRPARRSIRRAERFRQDCPRLQSPSQITGRRPRKSGPNGELRF